MKITITFWPYFRAFCFLASFMFLLYVANYKRYDKNYCGTVVEKKDWSREGSKGRMYQEEYIIMKWDGTGELRRVDVNSETFYSLNIGSRACFDLIYTEPDFQTYQIYSIILTFFSLCWWMLMGGKRIDDMF